MPGQVEYSQEGRFLTIKAPPLHENELLLERFSGAEELSVPFQFRLSLLSPNISLDLKNMLRKPVTVGVTLGDATQRHFHGVFRSLKHAKDGGDVLGEQGSPGAPKTRELVQYEGILVPKLWFLSLDSNCRIFQNKTVPDIVENILTEAGITDFQFSSQTRDTTRYPPREYCVQYRESSLNFISRLLEEEGIFYYFSHTETKHTLIFADNSSISAKCPGQPVALYSYNTSGRPGGGKDAVVNLERVEQAHTGKLALSDYFFETPNLDLDVALKGDGPEEAFDYPGNYEKRGEGDRYARIRLEEREAEQFLLNGVSRCRSFRPGYFFALKEHYRADTNQDYFLTSVTHDAMDSTYRTTGDSAHSYNNTFQAIPKPIHYRPPRRATLPVVQGPQPALVVGKSGEEIWVDKYGRVKVQFFWDRKGKKDEESSCWVRVSQVWAGKNWGWMTIPRMGQEVIVDFLEGNPDRPLITGRVYNAEQMPPYTLPANQTQSGIKTRSSKQGGTDNFNEIRFEDLKGKEQIVVHAEKDMETTVENDDTQTIQNNRTIKVDGTHTETIKKDTTIKITEGNLALTLNQGNQSTKLDMGDQSTKLDMGNQSTNLEMGNQSTKLSLGKSETEAMQSIELKVGQSSIKIDQMGVTIQGMMIQIKGTMMTQVNGQVMVTIKGGITMIN